MGKYSRLGKNTILVFVGRIGAKVIGLLMLPFYTRWLSVEEYGLTDILGVYSSFIMSIVSCCIAESIFIFPKGQTKDTQKAYLSSGVAFAICSLSLVAIIFAAVNSFADYADIENSILSNIWLIYGLVAATFLQELFQQFARSIDKMIVYSVTGIVVTVATALFSFLLIPTYGVFGFVCAIIISNIIAAIYSLVCSKAYRYISVHKINGGKCVEMLKYSVPLIPNAIMWWLVSALNRPIMDAHIGMESIGLYAVANKFPALLSMVFTVFATSWQISVIEEYGKKDFSAFYNNVYRAMFLFLFLMFGLLTMLSEVFIRIFTTPDFYSAWIYMPMLTLGTLFMCVSGASGSVFSAVRKSKYFFYSSVWGAAVAIILNFILIPWLGLWGAVVSVMLSFMAMALSRVIYSWQYIHLEHPSKYIIMFLLAGCIACSVFIDHTLLRILFVLTLMMIVIVINIDVIRKFRLKTLMNRVKK